MIFKTTSIYVCNSDCQHIVPHTTETEGIFSYYLQTLISYKNFIYASYLNINLSIGHKFQKFRIWRIYNWLTRKKHQLLEACYLIQTFVFARSLRDITSTNMESYTNMYITTTEMAIKTNTSFYTPQPKKAIIK